MTLLAWLGLVGAALAGAFTALARQYRFGPFLPRDEIDDFSTLPAVTVDHSTSPEAQNSPPQPVIPPTQPLPPKPTKPMKIDTFCLSIQDYEGGPTDANHRNNNPGNCRCSPVGYLAKYGNVRCSPAGFAIFPTYEQGWEYLQAKVLHTAQLYPNWTIYQFFGDKVHGWAPSADGNDPKKYAEAVARRCGVSPVTTLAKLFG